MKSMNESLEGSRFVRLLKMYAEAEALEPQDVRVDEIFAPLLVGTFKCANVIKRYVAGDRYHKGSIEGILLSTERTLPQPGDIVAFLAYPFKFGTMVKYYPDRFVLVDEPFEIML